MSIVAAFAVPHPPLIIPQVGRGREKGIQATVDAYEEVGRRVAALAPDTVVVSSPHATMYRDYFQISPGRTARGSFAQYEARDAAYSARYDVELVGTLCDICEREGIAAGTDYEREPRLDHATMIPLHFIQKYYTGFELVRIGLSGLSAGEHYRLGRAIQEAARTLGRRVVYIASGDLSHKLVADGPYGYVPEGPMFDQRITDDFARGDLLDILCMDHALSERAAECGLRSFQIMAGALDRTAVQAELLSYEGPFGVGYGIAAFTPVGEEGVDEDRALLGQWEAWRANDLAQRRAGEDPYVQLARASLEAYVRKGKRITPPSDLPEDLLRTRAGCFVSLKVDGQLRGCIGTILPTQRSLAQEICANAISAGTRDPRFSAVEADELDDLVYDVDVLTTPEPTTREGLDPARYGVIVSCPDGRRGLLLPDLDGVDTVSEQVRIAAQKGRIDLDFDNYRLERFEVVRHL
ncbi:MAG: AmmeMemoRadiSam system protein A [Coriobacteriales bacterium]|nr:AmmeMemoRadiSam system protein A [Coriobacteriales bacterium]